jgi:hypothetical protein
MAPHMFSRIIALSPDAVAPSKKEVGTVARDSFVFQRRMTTETFKKWHTLLLLCGLILLCGFPGGHCGRDEKGQG